MISVFAGPGCGAARPAGAAGGVVGLLPPRRHPASPHHQPLLLFSNDQFSGGAGAQLYESGEQQNCSHICVSGDFRRR